MGNWDQSVSSANIVVNVGLMILCLSILFNKVSFTIPNLSRINLLDIETKLPNNITISDIPVTITKEKVNKSKKKKVVKISKEQIKLKEDCTLALCGLGVSKKQAKQEVNNFFKANKNIKSVQQFLGGVYANSQ
jgi:hypothetical protein